MCQKQWNTLHPNSLFVISIKGYINTLAMNELLWREMASCVTGVSDLLGKVMIWQELWHSFRCRFSWALVDNLPSCWCFRLLSYGMFDLWQLPWYTCILFHVENRGQNILLSIFLIRMQCYDMRVNQMGNVVDIYCTSEMYNYILGARPPATFYFFLGAPHPATLFSGFSFHPLPSGSKME